MVIDVKNVTVQYTISNFREIGLKEYLIKKVKRDIKTEQFTAVDNVSFSLDEGDFLGIIGTNGAGKSTLLATVTAAKPKIADYAFTTLEPNLGIVSYRDDKSFVMADIPGIIEGAHEGKGIGLRFLRHIERNSILLFMIPADTENAAKEYEILLNELKEYNPELLVKGRVLAISKSDMLDEKMMSELEAELPQNVPHLFISAMNGQGIKELKDLLWKVLHE